MTNFMERDILTYTIEKTCDFKDHYNPDSMITPLIISELFNSMQPHFPTYVTNLAEKTTRHFMAEVWEQLITPFYVNKLPEVKNGRSPQKLYIWPLIQYLGNEGYSEFNALACWKALRNSDQYKTLDPYGSLYWGKYNNCRHAYNKMMEKYPLEPARWTHYFCPLGPIPESHAALIRNLLGFQDRGEIPKHGRWCAASDSIVYDMPEPYVERDEELLEAMAKHKEAMTIRINEAKEQAAFYYEQHKKSIGLAKMLETTSACGLIQLEQDMDAKKPERVALKRKAQEAMEEWERAVMQEK